MLCTRKKTFVSDKYTRPITVLWAWQTAKLWRLTTSYHVLITAGTQIITCASRVLYVLTTCAVRACPRSKVLSSLKLYSASDAVPIFPHVLPRLQRGCSSSSTRTTSAVSRETTFWRFLAVIKPSSVVWPGLKHSNHFTSKPFDLSDNVMGDAMKKTGNVCKTKSELIRTIQIVKTHFGPTCTTLSRHWGYFGDTSFFILLVGQLGREK